MAQCGMVWHSLVSSGLFLVSIGYIILVFCLVCSILPGWVLLAWFGMIGFGCLVWLGQISPTP
jgi:hypothetical protein